MNQYMSMSPITIQTPSGEMRKVNARRKRIKYDPSVVFIGKLEAGEELRADLMANRLYRNVLDIGLIIDVNDKDILSFQVLERVDYVNPGIK